MNTEIEVTVIDESLLFSIRTEKYTVSPII